ncbi:hypothetical protein [Listeria seeligeri]|uniref:Uncharacterized protein n=1 Tax=Listeria seeligeri FSL N1-067 TaxID=702453 RepID=E3ZLK3_LISSE|nr:hypothetical protein [Listeria seeligeri]EFS01493.1 hypothetical protein NT03LS_0290 [Listeria seeligeri FSL N1-067]EFS04560.1 hypothetical protein NT04LS_0251 [Listeria seeligeri FSL S4-171]
MMLQNQAQSRNYYRSTTVISIFTDQMDNHGVSFGIFKQIKY